MTAHSDAFSALFQALRDRLREEYSSGLDKTGPAWEDSEYDEEGSEVSTCDTLETDEGEKG